MNLSLSDADREAVKADLRAHAEAGEAALDAHAERGDVRVISSGRPSNTTVEVFDGAAWLKLRLVTSVKWECRGKDVHASLSLALRAQGMTVLTPAERVAIEIVTASAP